VNGTSPAWKRRQETSPSTRTRAEALAIAEEFLPLENEALALSEPLSKYCAAPVIKSRCNIMVEQIRAIDRTRIGDGPQTKLSAEEMVQLEKSVRGVLGTH
jgi:hypothetical protein